MNYQELELTKDQAVTIADSMWWKTATPKQIVGFQLFTPKLCCPFSVFHEAVELALDRPVYTHEFAAVDNLRAEYLGEKEKPTLQEIISLIGDKSILVVAPPAGGES